MRVEKESYPRSSTEEEEGSFAGCKLQPAFAEAAPV